MTPERHKWVVNRLPDRLAYWYAERFGEHPTCSECDATATFIMYPGAEPVCLKHSGQGQFGGGAGCHVGMIRDVYPEDHFGPPFK